MFVLREIAADGNLVIAKDYLGLKYIFPDWNFNKVIGKYASKLQGYQISS